MVDPIEVKLDEIDSKIDQIAYAKVDPRRYYEITDMGKMKAPSTATGGTLEAAIKSLTGSFGIGRSLAAGAAAGGVVGAVMILTDVLKESIKQSKIASTLQENVTRAMGLMMDLVLLPFLPMLTWEMIKLYNAIMFFGGWWQTVWETIKKEGLVGLVKLSLDWIWETLEGWEKSLTEWLFGDKSIGEKVAEVTVSLLMELGGIFTVLGQVTIGRLLDWIFGEGTYAALKPIMIEFVSSLIDNGIAWIKGAFDWVFGDGSIGKTIIDLSISVAKLATPFMWLWDLVQALVTGDFSKISKQLHFDVVATFFGGGGGGGTSNTNITTNNTTNNNGFDLFGMLGSAARSVYEEGQRIMDSRYSAGGW